MSTMLLLLLLLLPQLLCQLFLRLPCHHQPA
jgi:hypothetical protein